MISIGAKKAKVFVGSKKVKKIYVGDKKVYSAGNLVTYIVDTDTNTSYDEEVDDGLTILSPITFTPAKTGWTFVGWREDTVASSSVLSIKVMGDEPITLYAVYSKAVTANFISGIDGANKQTVEGTAWYNAAGNVSTIDITAPTGATASGWSWRGWAKYWDDTAAASVFLANGETTTINHENNGITYYGLYEQTITLSYSGNGSTSGSVTAQTGTRYHNSYGKYSNPSFTLAENGFTRSGYNFTGWDLGDVRATVTLEQSTTATAQWEDAGYYAIQEGKLKNCPNASAWCGGSLNVSVGEVDDGGTWVYYGGSSHTGGSGDNSGEWGADTGTLQTNGCKYLDVGTFVVTQYTAKITIYGNGAEIQAISIDSYGDHGGASSSRIIDISAYSNVRVRINAFADEDAVMTISCGFQNIRIYN